MFPDCIDVTLILIRFVFIYGEVFSQESQMIFNI